MPWGCFVVLELPFSRDILIDPNHFTPVNGHHECKISQFQLIIILSMVLTQVASKVYHHIIIIIIILTVI